MSASRRLINQLARREVAIVSPYAGTTRDVIEVQLDLDGYPVTVIDTAGIRETDDPVEQEGVRRARARAAEADLVLWLFDSAAAARPDETATPLWMVRNKIDLGAVGSSADFEISADRGDGIPALISSLVGFAQDFFGAGEGGLITRDRQRQLLQQTAIFAAAQHFDVRGGRGTRRGGFARGRLRTGAIAGPCRCRGYSGCDLPGILYRKVIFLGSFLYSFLGNCFT